MEDYTNLPLKYQQPCQTQLTSILNAVNIPDISASYEIPDKEVFRVADWFKITLQTEVGIEKSFVEDCNIKLDLTGGDILYHNNSIRDTMETLSSFCDTSKFLTIALRTNQGRIGYKFYIDNEGWVNFKFAFEYEHEHPEDETLSWNMQLSIIYSFKKSDLPEFALAVTAEYVSDLMDNIELTITKEQILLASIVIVVCMYLGPEIGALLKTFKTTETFAEIVSILFDAIKSLV